jgi:hypothetical protein
MNIQLEDVRVIGTLGPYAVEAAHHEVDMRYHSLHRMHFVRQRGFRSKCLRALQLEDRRTYLVFDLCALASTLRADLPLCAERDVPGLVKFTLRGMHPTGAALRHAIAVDLMVCGVPDARLPESAA